MFKTHSKQPEALIMAALLDAKRNAAHIRLDHAPLEPARAPPGLVNAPPQQNSLQRIGF